MNFVIFFLKEIWRGLIQTNSIGALKAMTGLEMYYTQMYIGRIYMDIVKKLMQFFKRI
jgi:hypothetical protein